MEIDWNKWDAILGTISDAKLANHIGCAVLTVKNRRYKRGVPCWMERAKAESAARRRPCVMMPQIAAGISAIYRIVNTVTQDEYIGVTKHLDSRLKRHATDIASGNHKSPSLRADVAKYGDSAFIFDLLEVCLVSNATTREAFWIKSRNPKYNHEFTFRT